MLKKANQKTKAHPFMNDNIENNDQFFNANYFIVIYIINVVAIFISLL